jgi:hypothetical protein
MAPPRVSPSTRVLLTDLSPEECRVALQATVGDLRNRALFYDQALRRAFPVVGSVSAERFTIRRTPQSRNSFPTRIHGSFAPAATGTRITVTPEPSPLVLLAALAAGVLVLAQAAALLVPIIGGGHHPRHRSSSWHSSSFSLWEWGPSCAN